MEDEKDRTPSSSEEENSDAEEMETGDEVAVPDYDNEIQAVKAKLEEDPYNTALNEQLMELYEKNGDFEELDSLRESVWNRGPLSVEGYKKWIEYTRNRGDDREAMQQLFKKALFDRNSPEMWIEYGQWSIGQGDPEFTRSVMDEAVANVGLRADIGYLIWELYLDFEELLLNNGIDSARAKVASLYKRALSIPTVNLEELWERYLKFADGTPEPEYSSLYENTKKALEALVPYEDSLLSSDGSIDAFTKYLEMEMANGDPGRIQSIFERIVDTHNEDENAWYQYGHWCEKTLKISSIACRVYARACRHCSYSCSLWQQNLLASERADESSEQIDSFWTKAKESIQNADEGRSLYRTYIYLLRRRAAASDKNYDLVSSVFLEGSNVLQEYFGKNWDPNAEYRRNYAFFLFNVMHDIENARKIWQDILASGSGRFAARWLEVVQLERQFGEIQRARKLLYTALNSVSDHPDTIYEYFIQFEREEGTLETLDKALEKVNAQVLHRSNRPQTHETKGKKDTEVSGHKRKHDKDDHHAAPSKKFRREDSANDKGKSNQQKSSKPVQKPPLPTSAEKDKDGFAMPGLPSKKPVKAAEEATSSSSGEAEKFTVFISNMDFKLTEDRIKDVLPGVIEVRLLYRGASKLHKGYGFVDFDSAKNMRAALAMDRVSINGRPLLISINDPEKRTGFKYETGLEKTKIFVRNVHYDCTKEQLKEAFSEFGEVRDVRIATHKSGKAKGVAYVDFSNEDAASRAVAASDVTLLGRTLSVALSNPPKKGEERIAHVPEKNEAAPPGSRKSHLQILPRSVKVSRPATNGSSSKAMSNDQFRQLFEKK